MKKRKTKSPPELAPGWEGQPTGFENDTILDRAFWLSERESWDPALLPVERADQSGDHGPIIEFLLSGEPITDFGRRLLADYLHRLTHKATPIYERTATEAKLLMAVDEVGRLVNVEGKRVSEALKIVEAETGIPAEPTLANAYGGRHGALRRAGTLRPYKRRKPYTRKSSRPRLSKKKG